MGVLMIKMKLTVILPRIVAVAAVTLCFAAGWKLLRYLVIDDTTSYTRVTMHEFYEQDDIDVLFMGASHCYRGFDVRTTDQMLGCNTFNLGSSSQDIDTTYLLMQEALDLYDVDHIYLEISYKMALLAEDRSTSLTNAYLITDYMRPSLRKELFLLERSGDGSYANSFLIARRSWSNLFDWNALNRVVTAKSSDAYKDFSYVEHEEERYAGKGFVESDCSTQVTSFKMSRESEYLTVESIPPDWVETIKKMVDLCRKRDVKLTLVCTPISSYRLLCAENYDAYIDFVKELVEETGNYADYWDFNLLRETFWPDTTSVFLDLGHLNGEGAKKFSEIFCCLVQGEFSPEELFYDSIEEKYAALAPSFYGVQYDEPDEDDEYRTCRLIFNHPEKFCNRVALFFDAQDGSDQKEVALLKDWDSETEFRIPLDFTGTWRLEIADLDDPENVTNYYYTF